MGELHAVDTHNMVAFLDKSKDSVGFHEIVDFLQGSYIRYALVENPTIYISLLSQFWQTATVKTGKNGEVKLVATVDGSKKTITESSLRRHLHLDDDDGISMLPSTEIFEHLTLMGYDCTDQRFVFWKSRFAPQWKFLIHTILHCLSTKRTSYEQFSSNIATAVICLATKRKFNFSKMIFDGMVKNVNSHTKFLMYPRFIQILLNKNLRLLSPHTEVYAAPHLTSKVFSCMRMAPKGFLVVDTPLFPQMLVQDLETHHTPIISQTNRRKRTRQGNVIAQYILPTQTHEEDEPISTHLEVEHGGAATRTKYNRQNLDCSFSPTRTLKSFRSLNSDHISTAEAFLKEKDNSMAELSAYDNHNMVAFLDKSKNSVGFHEIVDFLQGSYIRYALVENPTIYTSLLSQFWHTAFIKTGKKGEVKLVAIVDGSRKTITESSLRRHLHLDDDDGISMLTNTEIFEHITLMGYDCTDQKLTFWKSRFAPQWRFFIHTILRCLSYKRTSYEQMSSKIATAIICLATKRKFNFSKMIFDGMVKNVKSDTKFLMYPRFIQILLNKNLRLLRPHTKVYAAPQLTSKVFSCMRMAPKGFLVVDTPLFPQMLVQDQALLGEGSIVPVETHHTPTSAPSPLESPIISQTDRRKHTRKGNVIAHSILPTQTREEDEPISTHVEVEHGGAATTDTSLDAGQGSGSINKTPSISHDSPVRGISLGGDEDSMQLPTISELMAICTTLQKKVTNLETTTSTQAVEIVQLKQTTSTQAVEIVQLKQQVERLQRQQMRRANKSKGGSVFPNLDDEDDRDGGEDPSLDADISLVDARKINELGEAEHDYGTQDVGDQNIEVVAAQETTSVQIEVVSAGDTEVQPRSGDTEVQPRSGDKVEGELEVLKSARMWLSLQYKRKTKQ